MKGWLARAVANTAIRGDDPDNRGARWARWFPPARSVDDARFQHAGEPYPRHWRTLPQPWPTVDPADPEIADALHAALDDLPKQWREVVLGASPPEITQAQRRDIRNHAVALLRERLALVLHRGAGR